MAVVTLTGPTCAGKTTLEAQLQVLNFGRAISHTTRQPRAGEVDGVAYHFVTDDEYENLNWRGKFIETVEFGNARYAMSADSLNAAHKQSGNVVIVAEPHGAGQIHNFCSERSLPSFAVWVDCGPETQAKRWLSRMMSDMVVGKEVMNIYAERMATMLTDEAIWRSHVKQGNDLITPLSDKRYDLFLDSKESTSTELALRVLNSLTITAW